MWNLIKMDFYRLFSSKTIKVGALVAGLLCAGYMFLSLGIVELSRIAFAQDPMAGAGLGLLLAQVEWVYGVDFAEIILGATAALSLFVGCMISANFIGAEQSCGYTKNFAGQLSNKGYMAISKFVVTAAAQLMVLVIYTAVSSLLAVLLFGRYINGYAIGTLCAALTLRFLLHLAINAIIIFLCTLTKSHAIAMVAGCIFGIGITKFVYMVASMLLGVMKINFDIASYMPDGVNSQLTIGTVGELAVKAIAVSAFFMAAFLMANYFVVKNRDVK